MTTTGPEVDVGRYLEADDRKTLLRFITCGSVDDGKSTLIGRLLYESKLIFDDQLAALEADSRRVGTQGGALDFALLVDGLAAEREQGITIDVAYRFFTTERRKFIVADTPGHEQYTRNMATGASTADVAVILADARKGVLTQTRRHSFIVAMLGIKHVALAVNKMDLVGYDQAVFDRIAADYREFAASLGLTDVTAIPISALRGDNVVEPGANMPWYDGPPLLTYLETVEAGRDAVSGPFRLPVQLVTRPDLDFRGYAGIITSGTVHPGDEVRVLPSGATATVERIVTWDGDLSSAEAGQSVTLTIDREIDVSRGDMITSAADPAGLADQFEAHLVWMHTDPLLPGRPYLMKLGSSTATCTVTHLKYGINVSTLERTPAATLAANDIAVATIATDRRLPFDPYQANRETGGFVLIDRLTNVTVGAGMIDFALRRSDNIHWQALDVTKEARVAIKGHRPGVVWFTGISGAGKSTIANALERRLHALGCHTVDPRWRQRPARAQPRPRLHRRRPGGEHPAGDRGRQTDGRCRPARARLVHLAIPRGARQRPGAGRRRRVRRGVRRHPAGGRRAARPQGPLPQGPGGRAAALHRHRLTVRAAPLARGPHRHRDQHRGGVGGSDRHPAARPGDRAVTALPDEARALATDADHQLAVELAERSAALLRALRASGLEDPDVLRKQGDRRSHELLVTELAARRPQDAVLSEEGEDSSQRLGARRVWIVDPLDGTREFGELDRPDWAVHVALVIDGFPVAGAVALPALGRSGRPPLPRRACRPRRRPRTAPGRRGWR